MSVGTEAVTIEREDWGKAESVPRPRISVVVCTLASPPSLARTIESLVAQKLPAGDFEIIVVHNGPSPANGAVPDVTGGPVIRRCHEPDQGLSKARNAGLSAASGEFVAFIDDDATADPSWLESLLAAFEGLQDAPACVGGRVIPEWQQPRPRWLRGSLLKFLSLVDLGDRRRRVDWPDEVLVGCNIAFRASELRDLGGFDPALGRRGALLYGNEEIALEQLVHQAGGSIIYEPAAVVRHGIPAERSSFSWFVRRVYYQGLTDSIFSRRYRMSGGEGSPSGHVVAVLKQRFRAALKGDAKPITALLAVPYAAGVLRGLVQGPGGP